MTPATLARAAKPASETALAPAHVRRLHFDLQNAILRFHALDKAPNGRDWLTQAERVEYDTLGGMISDLRAMLGRI